MVPSHRMFSEIADQLSTDLAAYGLTMNYTSPHLAAVTSAEPDSATVRLHPYRIGARRNRLVVYTSAPHCQDRYVEQRACNRPLNTAALAEIISEVHAESTKEQRRQVTALAAAKAALSDYHVEIFSDDAKRRWLHVRVGPQDNRREFYVGYENTAGYDASAVLSCIERDVGVGYLADRLDLSVDREGGFSAQHLAEWFRRRHEETIANANARETRDNNARLSETLVAELDADGVQISGLEFHPCATAPMSVTVKLQRHVTQAQARDLRAALAKLGW